MKHRSRNSLSRRRLLALVLLPLQAARIVIYGVLMLLVAGLVFCILSVCFLIDLSVSKLWGRNKRRRRLAVRGALYAPGCSPQSAPSTKIPANPFRRSVGTSI